MKTRIVLLEDHVVIRRALAALLSRDKAIAVVGEAGSTRELLLFDAPFDLLITDLIAARARRPVGDRGVATALARPAHPRPHDV